MVPEKTSNLSSQVNAVLEHIQDKQIIGLGKGKAISLLVGLLAKNKKQLSVVPCSKDTLEQLRPYSFNILDCNQIESDTLSVYIDSVACYNPLKQAILPCSSSLPQQKFLAENSNLFIGINESFAPTSQFNSYPIAIEILPFARSYVAKKIICLGGKPWYKTNFITECSNLILETYKLVLSNPIQLEQNLNSIPGVVANSLLAKKPLDLILT